MDRSTGHQFRDLWLARLFGAHDVTSCRRGIRTFELSWLYDVYVIRDIVTDDPSVTDASSIFRKPSQEERGANPSWRYIIEPGRRRTRFILLIAFSFRGRIKRRNVNIPAKVNVITRLIGVYRVWEVNSWRIRSRRLKRVYPRAFLLFS